MCFCGYHPGSDIPNSLVLASHVSLIILSRIQEVRVCELINNCEDINPPFHFYEFGPRGGFFRSAVWELEQVKTWGAALPRPPPQAGRWRWDLRAPRSLHIYEHSATLPSSLDPTFSILYPHSA